MSERSIDNRSEGSDTSDGDFPLPTPHVLAAEGVGSDPDGGTPLIAEVHLCHPSLFLTPTLVDDSVESIFVDPHVGSLLASQVRFFTVDGDADVESALAADETVREVTSIGTFGGGRVFRGVPTPETVPLVPAMAELGIRVMEISGQDAGWDMRLQFRDRETFRLLHDLCTELDVSFSLLTLRTAGDAGADAGGTSLTRPQREALVTALEMGYFDLPRRASQQDVAAALDVSASAVSQRLRRAVAELIDSTIADGVRN